MFSVALLATNFLWLGGCSANDVQVSSGALHQEHELASIGTEVTQPNQELSLGVPLNGGQYSLALQCSGEERSSTIEWSTSDRLDHGEIEVPCSSDGSVVHQELSLDGYTRSLSFDVSGLQGQRLHVSVAGDPGS